MTLNVAQILKAEKAERETVDPPLQTVIHTSVAQCYTPSWQLHFDFGDLRNGVCHVIEINEAERNPTMGILTHQRLIFILDPNIVASHLADSNDSVNSFRFGTVCWQLKNNFKNISK